ncbi:hypothetical protein ADUPG1_008844 [Aduncisulcus paluster]|uniref:Uncharacterized protein n=1 Tax=Aduncisulcus paluster TaxID=2918883 RepID=A0ABQ5KUR2_9EUKA|nr:hypothetical protein ADUPG1_008844 [Aduncisulcus paluster]
MLSAVPSILPHLSPKLDGSMEWCQERKRDFKTKFHPSFLKLCFDSSYSLYLSNCYPDLEKLGRLMEKVTAGSEAHKIYSDAREIILKIFLSYKSKTQIQEHQKELIFCSSSLSRFASAGIRLSDLEDMIYSILPHFSLILDSVENPVCIYNDFLNICECYLAYSAGCLVEVNWESFFLAIFSILKHFLTYGLENDLRSRFFSLFKFIASSGQVSTKSALLDLIKPHIIEFMKTYGHCDTIELLCFIMESSLEQGFVPIKSLSHEIRPLFYPIFTIVKEKCSQVPLLAGYFGQFLYDICFGSSPCQILEIYEKTKDILDYWTKAPKFVASLRGNNIPSWQYYISILSTVPFLVPSLSPKYDEAMNIYHDKAHSYDEPIFQQYNSNVCSFLFKNALQIVLRSFPMLSLIPKFEMQHFDDFDGYRISQHCLGMKIYGSLDDFDFQRARNINSCLTKKTPITIYNIFSGSTILPEHILQGIWKHGSKCYENDGKVETDVTTHSQQTVHSSLIKYTPPQHLLVKMTFTEERSMRQSMYDFIEQTGAGVEVLFDEQTHSFEGYNQYGWKEGMEIIVEEEEEENVHEEEIDR